MAAWHMAQLGDREKFEQFDRKEPRRAQVLKAQSKQDRKACRGQKLDLSWQALALIGVALAFVLTALVVVLLPPGRSEPRTSDRQ